MARTTTLTNTEVNKLNPKTKFINLVMVVVYNLELNLMVLNIGYLTTSNLLPKSVPR